jgi:flagellar biogenesis protein FliO
MAETNTPLRVPTLARCALTACLLAGVSSAALGEDRASTFRHAARLTGQSQHGPGTRFDARSSEDPRRDSPARIYPASHTTSTPQDNQRRVAADSPTTRSIVSPVNEPAGEPATPPYSPPDFGEQTDFRALLSRVFVATVGVLVACCASIWLAKRFLTQSSGKPSSDSSLKLLATLPISRRGCVQLIQADDTKLVVAIDAGALKSMIPLTESFAREFLNEFEDSDAENVQLEKPKRKII